MKRNMASGQGVMYSIFSGGKLTQNDVSAITNYTNAVKGGVKPVQAYKDNLGGCSVAAKRYVVDAKKAGKSTDEMVAGLKEVPKATSAASIGLKALSIAGNMLMMMGISLAIQGLITLFDNLIHRSEKIQEAANNARSAIDDVKSSLDNLKTTTNDVKKRYAELAQEVENLGKINQSQGSLSTDEYAEFLNLSNQLADLFPQLTRGYDDNGNAILSLSGNVNTIVGSLNDLVDVQQRLANLQILENMPDVWEGYINSVYDDGKIDRNEYKDVIKQNKVEQDAILKMMTDLEAGTTSSYGSLDSEFGAIGVEMYNAIDSALKQFDLGAPGFFRNEFTGIVGEELTHWDFSSLTEEQMSAVRNALGTLADEYQKEIELTTGKLKTANAQMSGYINTWLSTEWNFSKMAPRMQNVVKDVLLNSDWISMLPDDVDASNWDEVSNWLQQNFLYTVDNIDNKQIESALVDVFNGEFTVESLQGVIDQLIKTEGFDENNPLIIYLKTKMGDREGFEKNYNSAANKYGAEGKAELEKAFKDNSIDTQEELDNWIEVTKGAKNATKAVAMYAESKENANKITVSLSELEKASDKISKLGSAFKELSDDGYITTKTIGEIQEVTGISGDKWEEYQTKLMRAKVGTSEFNQVMSDLTYAILESEMTVEDLANADEAYIARVLEENGVLNASEVAHDAVIKAKIEMAFATQTTVEAFLKEIDTLGLTKTAVGELQSAFVAAQNAMTAATSEQVLNRLKLLKEEVEDVASVAEAYELIATSRERTKSPLETPKPNSNIPIYMQRLSADEQSILDYATTREKIQSIIDNMSTSVPQYSSSDSKSSSNADKAEKEELERFKEGLETREKILERYKKSVDLTDFGLDIAEENDFALRADLLNNKMSQLTSYGLAMREEFDRISSIIPETGEQAEALGSTLETLGEDMRDNITAIRETQVAMEQLKIDSITSVTGNHLKELESELASIEKRMELLNKDNGDDYKYTNEILAMEMFLPTSSSLSGARNSRRKADQDILASEQATQDALNEILVTQIQKNEKLREDERQHLLENMEQMRSDTQLILNSVGIDYENSWRNTQNTTNTGITNIETAIHNMNLKLPKPDISLVIDAFNQVNELIAEMGNIEYKPIQITTPDGGGDVDSIIRGNRPNIVANVAKGQLGVDYVWGGISPGVGLDCSGLTQYAYRVAGVNIPRTSQEQWNSSIGTRINRDSLRKGDQLFFGKEGEATHTGIYVGNGQMIHAPRTGDVIRYASIDTDYYRSNWIGAKRYATGTPSGNAQAGRFGIAGENFKPEILIDKATGKAKYINTPTLIDISKTDVVGEKETANLPKFAEGTLDNISTDNALEEALAENTEAINANTEATTETDPDQALKDEIERIQGIPDKYISQIGEATLEGRYKSQEIINDESLSDSQKSADLYEVYKPMAEAGARIGSEAYKELLAEYLAWVEAVQSKQKPYQQEIEDAYLEGLADIKDTVSGFEENSVEFRDTTISNIIEPYNRAIGLLESRAQHLDSQLQLAETKGLMASTRYYEKMQDAENRKLEHLKSQRDTLTNFFNEQVANGDIEVGSSVWYDLQNQIDEITLSIDEATIAVAKFDNQMRQVLWDRFDYLIDSFSHLTSEADFLVDLLGEDLHEDNGRFNDKGMAVMGLHGANYNTYMEKALSYGHELEKIEEEIAKNPYDTNLIARKQELLGLQRDSILAAENEKEAIVSLVEEGINLELDALQELINKYKENLNSAKD